MYKQDISNYYYFNEGFSEEDIASLEGVIDSIPFEKATILSGIDEDYRRSKVKWIPREEKFDWVYERMNYMINQANENSWRFNLSELSKDTIQYTVYDSNVRGMYDWHIDCGPNNKRKISIVTQLSSPEEYEGGTLLLKTGRGDIEIPRKKGFTVVFPSFLLHRVTEVTSGVRKSLVLWVGGCDFT